MKAPEHAPRAVVSKKAIGLEADLLVGAKPVT